MPVWNRAGLRLRPMLPRKPGWVISLQATVPPYLLVRSSGVNSGPGPPRDWSMPGKSMTSSCRPLVATCSELKASSALVRLTKTNSGGRSGRFWSGLYGFQTISVVGQSIPSSSSSGRRSPLGSGGGPPPNGPPAGIRGTSGAIWMFS